MPQRKPWLSPALKNYLSKDGMQTKVAVSLGIARQAVSQWANGLRPVPLGRIPAVEEITGIDRELIRPDIYRIPKKKNRKRRA